MYICNENRVPKYINQKLAGELSGRESACQCMRRGFNPWVGKTPWIRNWQRTPAFLPGKFHGQRSLAGKSSWILKRHGHDLSIKQQQQIEVKWRIDKLWWLNISISTINNRIYRKSAKDRIIEQHNITNRHTYSSQTY